MDDNTLYFFIVMLVALFLRDKTLERYINKKNNTINKKLNALLDTEGIEYPKVEDISYKAKQAIKGGDRNKAMELILKETECREAQALALIEKLEKLNMP